VVVASARVPSNPRSSGQKARRGVVTMAEALGKKKQRKETRWGMTGGARLSAARALLRAWLAVLGRGAAAGPGAGGGKGAAGWAARRGKERPAS